MGIFRKKDDIEEFAQMRTALKRAERPSEDNDLFRNGGSGSTSDGSSTDESARATSPRSSGGANPIALAPHDHTSIVSGGSAWSGNLKVEGSVSVEGQLSGEIDAGETSTSPRTPR